MNFRDLKSFRDPMSFRDLVRSHEFQGPHEFRGTHEFQEPHEIQGSHEFQEPPEFRGFRPRCVRASNECLNKSAWSQLPNGLLTSSNFSEFSNYSELSREVYIDAFRQKLVYVSYMATRLCYSFVFST